MKPHKNKPQFWGHILPEMYILLNNFDPLYNDQILRELLLPECRTELSQWDTVILIWGIEFLLTYHSDHKNKYCHRDTTTQQQSDMEQFH